MKFTVKKNLYNGTTEGGYALLFTLVVISLVSLLAYGIINSTYKQLILSSLATDSQTAFYKADTGAECALYIDLIYNKGAGNGPTRCDIQNLVFSRWSGVTDVADQSYTVSSSDTDLGSARPCYEYDVIRVPSGNVINVTMYIKGYNTCLKNSSYKTVERALKIEYQR